MIDSKIFKQYLYLIAIVAITITVMRANAQAGSPDKPAENKRPNVIFISIDTLRADHLGCYGYNRPTSPVIDKLAGESVRFAQASSQSSWTLPSHMTMMTSLYPHIHKVETGKEKLAESATTLAEVLSRSGYYTTAFVSWVYVTKRFGFGQGFDDFAELLPAPYRIDSSTRWSYKATEVTNIVLSTITRKPPEQPFFMFIHYFDPHINYEPQPPYDTMFDPDYKGQAKGTFRWLKQYIKGMNKTNKQISPRDLRYITSLYDGEICYTDSQILRLLRGINKFVGLDNCLIVLTSDHGEEFNEHGSMEGHQWTLYDEVVHVPMLFRFPNKTYAGKVITDNVGQIDIAPTILGYLNITPPKEFQGRSFMPVIDGSRKSMPQRTLFAETRRHTIKQSARLGPYKLIHTDHIARSKHGRKIPEGYQLYDLQKDPSEQNDIYDPSMPIAKKLLTQLHAWRKTEPTDAAQQKKQSEVKLSPEDEKRLRSLGYVN